MAMTSAKTKNQKRKTKNEFAYFPHRRGRPGDAAGQPGVGGGGPGRGLSPLVSETHGMAQRGGIVVSTVVLGELKSPIISLGKPILFWGLRPWRPSGP